MADLSTKKVNIYRICWQTTGQRVRAETVKQWTCTKSFSDQTTVPLKMIDVSLSSKYSLKHNCQEKHRMRYENNRNPLHNLICNARGKGKPCLKLSHDFEGWMGKENSPYHWPARATKWLPTLTKSILEERGSAIQLGFFIKIQSTSAILRSYENALLNFILIPSFSDRERMVLAGWSPPSSLAARTRSSNIFVINDILIFYTAGLAWNQVHRKRED